LDSNGTQLAMTDEEVVRLFLDIAAGLLSRDDVERLLRPNVLKRMT
jgi:prophage maintenance system killer protein